MLVDKTNFGIVVYDHANFYRFEESTSYWSVQRISVFLCFSLVNQRHTSGITVYNRTVTNIENTVRAVHSCNNWFYVVYICCLCRYFYPIVKIYALWCVENFESVYQYMSKLV